LAQSLAVPFWTYMLHMSGGTFYVGHTDDLERRYAEHKSGSIPGYTSGFDRIELVWCEEFQTRDDAKACERKLKGWGRQKKLALIRGDWARISALARNAEAKQGFDKLSLDGVGDDR
jgi:predicted GIY-YIG superfamily endonuclease